MRLQFLLRKWRIRNGETYRNHVLVGPASRHSMPRPSVSSHANLGSSRLGEWTSAYQLAVLTYSSTCPRS
jgi:hypothetical protein